MEDVENWLKVNGLILVGELKDHKYTNDKCEITIYFDYYEVHIIHEEGTMYSKDLNIYWLIGVLTYYNLIDRNYVSLY